MSDYLPFEIQIEIIKWLPVESLIRFRSVSKPWKSLISSSEFIADHKFHHSQRQHLLVRYKDQVDSKLKYVSINDDDDTKCSLNAPVFFNSINEIAFLGASRGLFCLHGYSSIDKFEIAVLWNPSIRKSVAIKVPGDYRCPYDTDVGFGVCPSTNDPKLVRIRYIEFRGDWESISCIPRQVEVFTLSSMAWRIPSTDPPRKSICFGYSDPIVTDRFLYWIAFDRTTGDDFAIIDEYYYSYLMNDVLAFMMIISFDLTSEEFDEIYLPEPLEEKSLSISKLRDSLVIFDRSENGENLVYGVWMMEPGVPGSFTKLFTIDVPNALLSTVLGFRENGELVFETIDNDEGASSHTLKVFEHSSKHIKDLAVCGEVGNFFVSSYMETLILLDQPDSSIYPNM